MTPQQIEQMAVELYPYNNTYSPLETRIQRAAWIAAMQMQEERIKEVADKYQRFVGNLEWHIKTNSPDEPEMLAIGLRLNAYKEIVKDLSTIFTNQPTGAKEGE